MGSSRMNALDSILHEKTNSNEPEFKGALARLRTEIRSRLETPSPSSIEFFSSTLRLLSRMKGTAHAEIRINCLLDAGHYLHSNGYNAEALDAVRYCEELAARSKHHHLLQKAQTLGGIIHGDLGSVANAVISYSNALRLAKEANDPLGEAAIFVNLGCALNYGGLYREAIPCFERVVRLCRTGLPEVNQTGDGHPPVAYETAALSNLALSYLSLEEFESAFETISECLAKSSEPHDLTSALGRTIRELTCVIVTLELGKMDTARAHRDLCLDYSRSGGIRANLLARIGQGLCEIYGGNSEEGLSILELVRESSRSFARIQLDVLEALVRGYDRMGRPERALQCLNALMQHIREARETGIAALLSWPQANSSLAFARESDDLRAFKLKESQLRSKVAEIDAINCRLEMFERLAVAADLKEEASGEHGYRVGKLASLVADCLGWSRDRCLSIDLAARLHDIGKIGMPDRLLLTSKQLLEGERRILGTHTLVGAELLSKSSMPQLKMAEEIARHHHEWWDGSGYPSKLAGKRIPLHARIVALADVFDALTHGRPFAEPWSINRALEEIRNRRGTQFDPDLTDLFVDLIGRLRSEHADLDAFLGKAGRASPFLQAREKIRQMLAEERENERNATLSGSETRH